MATRKQYEQAKKDYKYMVKKWGEPAIFKDPKTDNGIKKSQKGRVGVFSNNGEISFKDGYKKENHQCGILETVFLNGKLTKEISLSEIRENIKRN